eukprot:scaffold66598_cov66-Phaeocystis_antarctica.AAC.7
MVGVAVGPVWRTGVGGPPDDRAARGRRHGHPRPDGGPAAADAVLAGVVLAGVRVIQPVDFASPAVEPARVRPAGLAARGVAERRAPLEVAVGATVRCAGQDPGHAATRGAVVVVRAQLRVGRDAAAGAPVGAVAVRVVDCGAAGDGQAEGPHRLLGARERRRVRVVVRNES